MAKFSAKVAYLYHPLLGLGNLGRGTKRTEELEDGEVSCKKMSSEHDMVVILMISLHL